jgi:hypothetical protein
MKEAPPMMLADALRSRYLLHRGLVDAGVPATRACLAVDVLLGTDPDQADDDAAAWPAWTDRDRWTTTEPDDAQEWRPPYVEEHVPSEADWEDYCRRADRAEALETLHRGDEREDRMATLKALHRHDHA